jgi:hypothetical protein
MHAKQYKEIVHTIITEEHIGSERSVETILLQDDDPA